MLVGRLVHRDVRSLALHQFVQGADALRLARSLVLTLSTPIHVPPCARPLNILPLAKRDFFVRTPFFPLPLVFFLMIRRPPRSTLFPYTPLFLFFLKSTRPTAIPSFTSHAVFRF